MLGGEGLGLSIWRDFIRRFSDEGYAGVACSLPGDSLQSSDDTVAYLRDTVENNHMIPPLLLAHSLSCHTAIQYLESHSLAGVVLLNPVPVNAAKAAAMLSTRYADCASTAYQSELEQSASSVARRYYNITGPAAATSLFASEDDVTPSFPKALMRNIASSRQKVMLEACSVPACVIMTAGDDALFDLPQEQELLNLFGIDHAEEESSRDNDYDEGGMSAAVNEESACFLRLRYNLSRVAHTSDLASQKTLAWAETFL